MKKLNVIALAIGLLGLGAVPAHAAGAEDVFLVAGLRGADQDGSSTVALKIKGNEVSFAIRWDKIDVPRAAQIHLGARGETGAAQLDLVTGQLPKNTLGVSGTTTADPAVVSALLANPKGFYASLDNTAFPGGAVRGQLNRLERAVDLRGVLQGGDQASLSAAAGPATFWLRPAGTSLAYTATWENLATPAEGHIHYGVEGPVVADLFSGLQQQNLSGISGQAPVGDAALKQIVAYPERNFASLHNAAGFVTGPLSAAPFAHPRSFAAEVLLGAQIYACTKQADGSLAFTQYGVTARLARDINHTFVQPVAGPPQWVAPDHSAVRVSSVVEKIPNGAANIAELVLNVSQTGSAAGLVSQATTVMRLNTRAGVAPQGTCVEGARTSSVYHADYLFLG